MSTDELHVQPINDLIKHTASEECPCGPRCDPVERADETYGWSYVHHSLDGREKEEPDYEPKL